MMLGRTAGNLFWMFRYLERMENTARLLDAGFQISLSGGAKRDEVWQSVINAADVSAAYEERHEEYSQENVVDFLLRDNTQPYSARAMLSYARDNARAARTALTNEIWQAINGAWLDLDTRLKKHVKARDLPEQLEQVRSHSQQVRGALHGTMLRNDIYDFLRLGNFIERIDATARIMDVKYYVLLPSVSHVGSSLDNVQWETILRSVSAHECFRWLHQGTLDASAIADFLILDRRFPRSIAYSVKQNSDHLTYLAKEYNLETPSLKMALTMQNYIDEMTIDRVFAIGLHEFLRDCLEKNTALAQQIEEDFRFYG